MKKNKQKVYISYAHREGKKYKEYLEEMFKDLISNKTVKDEDLYPGCETDYINKLINDKYIDEDISVIVLIGKSTRAKKYVDWEIYTGLEHNCNVIGVLLPEFKLRNGKVVYADIPARLADNIKSGYSKIYTWNTLINDFVEILSVSYKNKEVLRDNKINTRKLLLLKD